jgi:hypothetical protein
MVYGMLHMMKMILHMLFVRARNIQKDMHLDWYKNYNKKLNKLIIVNINQNKISKHILKKRQ